MSLKNNIRRDNLVRLFTVLGTLGLIMVIILKVDNMLPSMLLAFVIYYLFGPPVSLLERKGIPRILSVTILFAAAVVLLTFSIILAVPLITEQVASLRQELPRYINGITLAIGNTETWVNGYIGSIYETDISGGIKAKMVSWSSGIFEGLPVFAQKFFSVSILAPFFAFFMLLDGKQTGRSLLSVVPNNLFEMGLNLMHQLNQQMGDFIRARLLEAVIVGLVVWVGLAVIDFRFASLLALFAAIFNLIPYVGPVIGAVPALIVAFINGEPSLTYILILSIYGFAQLVDMVFIIPLVVAKIVDLHPVTVVVVIIIGAQLLGILGMIISIPVTSAIKLIFNSVFTHIVQFRR